MRSLELNLETPCQQRWEQLEGESAQRRHCASCQQTVHNLSALSAQDAHALLMTHAERGLCVIYVYDDRGQVMHLAPDATRVFEATSPPSQRRGVQRLLASAVLALGMLPMLSACGGISAREYQEKPWADAYAPEVDALPQAPSPAPVAEPDGRGAQEERRAADVERNQLEQERRVTRQLMRYGLRVEAVDIR